MDLNLVRKTIDFDRLTLKVSQMLRNTLDHILQDIKMRFELLATVSKGTRWLASSDVRQRPGPQDQILTQIWEMWKIPYKMLIDDIYKLTYITCVHISDLCV